MPENAKSLSFNQFLGALKTLEESVLEGDESALQKFSHVINNLMPPALINGAYKSLGNLIKTLNKDYIELLSPRYEASQRDVKRLSSSVKDVLETVDFILEKLSNNDNPNPGLIKETLSILTPRMEKMKKLKSKFGYLGHNMKLRELIVRADKCQLQINKYLGTHNKNKSKQLITAYYDSVSKELFEGDKSLLGCVKSISQKEKPSSVDSHLKIFSDSIFQVKYRKIILNIIRKSIQQGDYRIQGMAKPLEDFVNFGSLSKELWIEYNLRNGLDEKTAVPTELQNSVVVEEKPIVNDRYQILNFLDWNRLKIGNTIGIPYMKSCRNAIVQYKKSTISFYEALSKIEQHLSIIYKEETVGLDLQKEFQEYQQHALCIFAAEIKQKKGKSLASAKHAQELQVAKNSIVQVKERMRSLKLLLSDIDLYDALIQKQLKYKECLILLEESLNDFIVPLEKYIENQLPKNIHTLFSEKNTDNIQNQHENIILRSVKGVKDFSEKTTPYCIVSNPAFKIQSFTKIEELCLSLDKLLPIFKRTSGSLSKSNAVLDKKIKTFLDCEDSKEYAKLLKILDDYLLKNTLKAKQVCVLYLPCKGAGSYDLATNTILLPMFVNEVEENENIYFAIADFIYTTMIKSRDDEDLKDFIEKLSTKYPKISNRIQRNIIVVKILVLIVMEMNENNRPSGLSNKIKDSFNEFLSHSNELIIFRDLAHVSALRREKILSNIFSKYEITKASNFKHELQNFLLKDLTHLLDVDGELNHSLIECVENMEFEALNQLFEDIYDAAVILFTQLNIKDAYSYFHLLAQLQYEEAAIWWNIATITRFHPFSGMEMYSSKPKEYCVKCYEKFEKTTKLSEYWKMKSKKLRLSIV